MVVVMFAYKNAVIPGNLAQALILEYPVREDALLLSPAQREWLVLKTEQAKKWLNFYF